MKETITDKFVSIPASYARNNSRIPVDGMFMSSSIKVNRAGYTSFQETNWSDHRGVWVEFSYQEAFGIESYIKAMNQPRKLTCESPKVVLKYNKETKKALEKAGLIRDLKALYRQAGKFGWSDSLAEEYNMIQEKQIEIRKLVESKIRKLKTGAIPWSPTMAETWATILMWKILRKSKEGRKVDKKYIKRLARSAKEFRPWDKSLEEVKEELTKCYAEYKKLIPQALSIREDFTDVLALDRAEANGTTFEAEKKKLSTIQCQRRLARAAKLIRRKLGKNPTVKVIS